MHRISKQGSPDNEKLVAVFNAVCTLQAMQYGNGKKSLQDAVDFCQDHALTRGLVELLGQDEVQLIIAAAFIPVRP